MPIKNYTPEQIVTILRQIEVKMANGKTAPRGRQDLRNRLVFLFCVLWMLLESLGERPNRQQELSPTRGHILPLLGHQRNAA